MGIIKKKKVSSRRQQVRNTMAAERLVRRNAVFNSPVPALILIFALFILSTVAVLSLDTQHHEFLASGMRKLKAWPQILSLAALVILVSAGASFYIYHFQPRMLNRPGRVFIMALLFWLLLTVTRIGSFFSSWVHVALGTVVVCAIIMTIVFNQRFALGMSLFYALLACLSLDLMNMVEFFLTMTAAIITICFSLREIRTRMKLINVSIIASVVVFITGFSAGVIQDRAPNSLSVYAGMSALTTLLVGVFVQAFLPLIEKAFGIATSMTLMDYSDANQPLLKKLAMDAPGTFSHSLLIGSIAEAAAESIGANGLLCRVGAYYHDIGKINKPAYFVENQMGSTSRHELLSPAMSQLVIVGHVKDGIEIAREFGLPALLRQFIETHHGTTLMEYFYNEARKKQDERQTPISETEFRYPGPKPRSKEAAIVMLADAGESAVRTITDPTPTKVEAMVHNIAMKRLQDGQFDDCDLTLRELSQIETSLSKSLAAHHHGRIAYPKPGEAELKEEAGEERTPNGAQV